MSISRSTYVMAVVASSLLTAPAWAEDLAASVAAKLRDSGALAGYRVNVKAKSGTVWLEGTVPDEKQLAAAIGVAETTPGVERVVNRLVVEQQAAAAQVPLGDTDFLAPVRKVISAPAIAVPVSNSDLRSKGFTKLVKRDDGVYENVTRSGDEARYMRAGQSDTLPHLHKKIGD